MLAPHGGKNFPSLADYMTGKSNKPELPLEASMDLWCATLDALAANPGG